MHGLGVGEWADRTWPAGGSPVVSPIVSVGVSGAVLGCDAPVEGITAGQAVDEPAAGEGDCISVQRSIPIYLVSAAQRARLACCWLLGC